MKQLVASWVEAEKEWHGNTLGEAVKRLNQVLGTNTQTSRVGEWRRATYAPSTLVVSHMLHRTLPWALERSGIVVEAGQRESLTALLWEVGIENGKPYVELE